MLEFLNIFEKFFKIFFNFYRITFTYQYNFINKTLLKRSNTLLNFNDS